MVSRRTFFVLPLAFLSHFCASRGSENLLTISVPDEVRSFEVRSSAGILWRIESPEPKMLSRIRYGEVPRGFVQTIPPANARPRFFVPGEEIETETTTSMQTVVHQGHARGPTRFEGGVWRSTPHQKQS